MSVSAGEMVALPVAPSQSSRGEAARTRPPFWRLSAFVLIGLFYIVPLLCSVKFALIQKNGRFGLGNFTAVVSNGALRSALITSLELAVTTALLVMVLVLPAAVLVRLKLPRLTFLLDTVTLLPLVIPPIVVVTGWQALSQSAPQWLVTIFFNHALTCLTPMYVVLALPLVYRAIDTGISAIDLQTLVDASRSLGGNRFTTLYRVILPNIQTAVVGGIFLTIALVLGELVLANQLGYTTLPTQMLVFASQNNSPGAPVAISLLMLLFTILLLFSLTFLARRRRGVS